MTSVANQSNPQEPELLPCPFCGSNGRIMTSEKLVFCMNPHCVSAGIQFRIWQTRATPPKAEGGRPDGCGTKCMSASDMAQKCIRLMDDLGHSDLANQIALRWGTDSQKKFLASNNVVEK